MKNGMIVQLQHVIWADSWFPGSSRSTRLCS